MVSPVLVLAPPVEVAHAASGVAISTSAARKRWTFMICFSGRPVSSYVSATRRAHRGFANHDDKCAWPRPRACLLRCGHDRPRLPLPNGGKPHEPDVLLLADEQRDAHPLGARGARYPLREGQGRPRRRRAE